MISYLIHISGKTPPLIISIPSTRQSSLAYLSLPSLLYNQDFKISSWLKTYSNTNQYPASLKPILRMAVVTYRDVTAIVQVVTLAPAILCALALIRRHGFSLAWWLMSMFTLSRMVGATALLVSIHHPGIGSQITFLISLYLGLSPLVLLCWSMLLRM